ncbi:MAG TPA: hypothetical protein VHZ95_18270, partial [Polyangiales bacterium]|nr:hypothetical protein [Polyangiales bacterium]
MRVLLSSLLIGSLVACSSGSNDRSDAAVGGRPAPTAGTGGASGAAISGSAGHAGASGKGSMPSAGRDAGSSDASQIHDAATNPADASHTDAGPAMPSGPVQTPGDPGGADV